MRTATVYIELVPERYNDHVGVTISCKKSDFPDDLKHRLERFLEGQGFTVEQPLLRKEG